MEGFRLSARRTTGGWVRPGAVLAAACLAASAGPARAATITEPFARLELEGGYDSNPYLDGRGGDRMGRVSPDLGVVVKDHLYRLEAAYGADFLLYPSLVSHAVVNQRADLKLKWRPARRWEAKLDARGTYTYDPVGLAQEGIIPIAGVGQALLVHADARVSWMAEQNFRLAATMSERAVQFQGGPGAIAHVPGLETAWILSAQDEVAAAYRLEVFRSLGGVAYQGSVAPEVRAIWRRKIDRRYSLELQAGPALWMGPSSTSVVPEGAATLLYAHRVVDLRLTATHELALGALARPGLYDSLESGVVWRAGRSWRLTADGGFWRGGSLPSGDNAENGYMVGGELAYLLAGGAYVGVAASRFARLDDTPGNSRDLFGLRVGWEVKPR